VPKYNQPTKRTIRPRKAGFPSIPASTVTDDQMPAVDSDADAESANY